MTSEQHAELLRQQDRDRAEEPWRITEEELEAMAENYYHEEAEREMRTRRQQSIEAVAGIILANDLLDSGSSLQTANDCGWGYDIRWDNADYVSEQDFTRVEGHVLSDEELEEAVALACEWAANPNAL